MSEQTKKKKMEIILQIRDKVTASVVYRVV